MNIPSDEDIKRFLASGNEKAIDRGVLYAADKYEAMVLEIFLKKGIPHFDADPLCNSVWLVLWSNADTGKYKPTGSLPGYLHRIASNLAHKYWRGRRPPKEYSVDWQDAADPWLNLLDDLPYLGDERLGEKLKQAIQRRNWRFLMECLQQLTDENLLIFDLFYNQSRKINAIAAQLGMKGNNVKQRLFGLRRQLRRCRDEKMTLTG